MLAWLERRLGRYAIQHLTLALIVAWIGAYVLQLGNPALLDTMRLDPERVAAGEVWRLATFMLVPPALHPLWLFFALYFYYLIGTALEAHWGAFRYNCYLLLGWVLTAGAAMAALAIGDGVAAGAIASNGWILASLFFAFAWLHPDFQILLFLILPVRVKWLALIAGAGIVLMFASAPWGTRLLILAALGNFLLFFGMPMLHRLRRGHRQMQGRLQDLQRSAEPLHRCHLCGTSDRDDPDRDFRVDTRSAGSPDICMPCLEARRRAEAGVGG